MIQMDNREKEIYWKEIIRTEKRKKRLLKWALWMAKEK
jgi:hypothetical protein